MEAAINERKTNQENWGTAALEQRRERSCRNLAAIAARRESWIRRNRYYYESLGRLLRFLVEPRKKVLSVRCGTGFHLAAVSPKQGKGVDLCSEIVEIARQQNPSFEFAVAFPDKEEFRELFESGEKFDYILFSNIGDTVDALQALRNLRPLCLRHTRVLVETYNHLWEPVVSFAEWLGMKVPTTEQNWLSTADLRNLMKLAGFEALETHRIVILPKYVPLLSAFLNRFCARLPLLKRFCMTQVVVGRLLQPPVPKEELSVSVIIPCKDEKGNVEDAAQRIPQLGRYTEIIFCDDQSTDGTAEEVLRVRSLYPDKDKFFSVAFTYLLGQRVKDTLCGTKVLWRSDWERIKPMLGSWGIEDRWGDYELLFGAAKLNLKILDLPVHYQERIYGSTKMTKVFRNGLVMLKMCWYGFLKLKLGY
jgi:SAM-dependent methyltransferase